MNRIDSLKTIVNIKKDRIFMITGNHSFNKIQKDFPILKKLSEKEWKHILVIKTILEREEKRLREE